MVNRFMFIGRICNDPELQVSAKGTSYIRVTLAIHDMQNGTQTTLFHRLIAFHKNAEYIAGNIKKGDLVYTEGPLIMNTIKSYTAEGKEINQQISVPMILKMKLLSRPDRDEEFVIEQPFHKLQETEALPEDIAEVLQNV